MLAALVRWCLQRRLMVATAAILLLVVGLGRLPSVKFDVFPDFVPAQAVIQTEAPGLTAEQVEQLVTRPVEQAVNGAAGVSAVRSESIQGLSVVTVVFAEGSDPYRARQVVTESLSEASGTLPSGVKTPKVEPLTSSTMDLLKIGLTSDKLSPLALRDLAQWTVRPRLLAAAGVARATLYGGQVRRIEVRVRPNDLAARDLSLSDILVAVQKATGLSGGGYIDTPQQRILVEPRGQALTTTEIAAGQIPGPAGTVPLRIGDLADVIDGPAPDTGDALIQGKPGVLIALSSQYGANTLDATHAVESALEELRPALESQGVKIDAGLHRPANFITAALGGISEDLAIGAGLIALVLFLFMRDLRTVLVSFISIPLSLLSAIMVVSAMGWTINTMTLGGLAVALGVVVDDAVIDVENIVRRLRGARGTNTPPAQTVLAASLEVRAPVIYATLLLALTLLPILMLHGLQGSFFSPLAAAFIIATLVSLAVAILITPPLALIFLGNTRLRDEPGYIVRAKDWHDRMLVRVCEKPRWAIVGASVATVMTIAGFLVFNSELLPAFRESHFVLQVSGTPGTSLAVMRKYGEGISHDILAIDGVQSIEQEIGRSEGGEDTWGTETSEFHVELAAKLSGKRQDEIEAAIHDELESYPGLQTEVVTFLGDRIGESFSGETASLAVGVYGADLDTLDRTADQIAAVLSKVDGAEDVKVATPPQTPVMRIDLNFVSLARYGLSSADVLGAVQAVYQGTDAAQIYADNRVVDIALTTTPELRRDPEGVGDLLLRSSSGIAVPLKQVAQIYLTEGRTSIAHEGGRPRQVVTANPKPADVNRVTKAAREAIMQQVKLPAGVYLEYTGTAAGNAAAQRELFFNAGLAAIGVVALLLIAFSSGRAVMIIVGSAPFALVGGVVAVGLTGATLSLGSLVGFITLFGIAARNTILLVSHTDHLIEVEGHVWSLDTVLLATRERTTPILMTALVTALGLLPLALQTGQAGREIQGPMAIVILGGLVSATIMSLVVAPALIWRYRKAPARP